MIEYDDMVLPVHPYTGLAAIGVLPSGRPVWPVIGASDDDPGDDGGGEDGDDPDDGDGGGDDDTGTPPADGWTPPTKAEWEEAERKRAKANKEAGRRRKEADALKAKVAALEAAQAGTPPAGDDADTRRIAAEMQAAQDKLAAATTRATAAVRAAARTAIVSAGYNGERDGRMMASLLGMVRLDELHVDDDGDITGLDDQIAEIKSELPALFASPEPEKPPRKAPKGDAGSKKPPPPPEQTYENRLAQQLGLRR